MMQEMKLKEMRWRKWIETSGAARRWDSAQLSSQVRPLIRSPSRPRSLRVSLSSCWPIHHSLVAFQLPELCGSCPQHQPTALHSEALASPHRSGAENEWQRHHALHKQRRGRPTPPGHAANAATSEGLRTRYRFEFRVMDVEGSRCHKGYTTPVMFSSSSPCQPNSAPILELSRRDQTAL